MSDTWDGHTERRATPFCSQHIQTVTDFAEMKSDIKNIAKTISESVTFRTGITIALVTMSLTIVIQIATFAFLWGNLTKQVQVNTARLDVIEDMLRK